MRRRHFVTLLGGALGWSLAALAQQAGKNYRIGFLANDPTIPTQAAGQAFLNGLRDSGFVEGKNVIIERRFAEARLDRYDDLFAELTRLQVHLIVTAADNATLAAKRSNIKIPAVMLSVTDPVGQGIVASLARPGQLQRQQLELATPSLKVSLRQFVARQVSDFATAFEAMRQDRSDVLFLTASSLNFVNRRRIVELAAQSRLPIKSDRKECTEAGGLMSYGYSRTTSFHRAAIYVGKILNGAKPGDLPVEQPTKYALVINLNAAKVLGLTVPPSLIVRTKTERRSNDA